MYLRDGILDDECIARYINCFCLKCERNYRYLPLPPLATTITAHLAGIEPSNAFKYPGLEKHSGNGTEYQIRYNYSLWLKMSRSIHFFILL